MWGVGVGDHKLGDHKLGDHKLGDHKLGDHKLGDHKGRPYHTDVEIPSNINPFIP